MYINALTATCACVPNPVCFLSLVSDHGTSRMLPSQITKTFNTCRHKSIHVRLFQIPINQNQNINQIHRTRDLQESCTFLKVSFQINTSQGKHIQMKITKTTTSNIIQKMDAYTEKLLIPSLLLMEILITSIIIQKVPYTEIDWSTYLQQVNLYLNGERDYVMIRGDTGPLVYPAGHLYFYSFLKDFSIYEAQWFFGVLYVLNAFVVFRIYEICRRCCGLNLNLDREDGRNSCTVGSSVWSYRIGLVLLCLSKRVHSIFVLRLFNDSVAMLLLYVSVWMFITSRWNFGCFIFSLAVSIKMNILLFAPGLLMILLQAGSSYRFTIEKLAICAVTQLLLGYPFLKEYPVSYLRKAFELDRVFMYKWTVNWKVRRFVQLLFLDELFI